MVNKAPRIGVHLRWNEGGWLSSSSHHVRHAKALECAHTAKVRDAPDAARKTRSLVYTAVALANVQHAVDPAKSANAQSCALVIPPSSQQVLVNWEALFF